jgi:hypothetical protein
MTTDQVIDAYLSRVTAGLPGPSRARRDVLAELRSGLLDATDAHRAAGLPAGQAAQAATREFGDPKQIAAAFRPELAARQARRLALSLVATGPLIGLLWITAAFTSHFGIQPAPPWDWPDLTAVSRIAVPLAAISFLISLWAALVTLAVTGRLTRWLPARTRLAPTTAAIAGFGTMTADLAIFLLLASQLASAPATLAAGPVAAAAAASLTRLTLARRAGRRCLTARAGLPPGHSA